MFQFSQIKSSLNAKKKSSAGFSVTAPDCSCLLREGGLLLLSIDIRETKYNI